MKQHTIFVFANLQPSQVLHKILPLSRSKQVQKIIILRKNFMDIPGDKIICRSIPRMMQIRPFYWMFVPLFGIYLIKRYKVTLILNYNIFPHGFNAYFASLFVVRPVIFSEINNNSIRFHQRRGTRRVINRILSHAALITVPGSRTENYWQSHGYLNTTRLHSTIDIGQFKPDGTKKKSFDFIFIGRFDQNKRADMIISAFSGIHHEMPGARLCMIGYGAEKEKLDQLIAKYKLSDTITIIKTNDVLEYLQQSKIFVMASLSEGLPCALMEAMACEVIPVVPDVGNIADVVTTGYNGALYDGSPEELEKWMKKMLTDYDSLETMRQNARNTIISGHSYEVATAKWDELLSKFN